MEGWGVGDSWKLALEVGGVAGAVLGVVEQGVGVVEDVPLGDGLLTVVGAELGEGPVGDVFVRFLAFFAESLREPVKYCALLVLAGSSDLRKKPDAGRLFSSYVLRALVAG